MTKLNTLLFVLGMVAGQLQAGQVVVNWGQNPTVTEKPLSHYCKNPNIDIINLTFLNDFSGTDPAKLNLAGHCYEAVCPNMERDIEECQKAGKKIFLALGGATGEYHLKSAGAATKLAKEVFNEYLDGTAIPAAKRKFLSARPDGIDLHLLKEQPAHYGTFLKELKRLQPRLLISATPQCPFRDASLHDVMETPGVPMHHVNVMFYNNDDCGVSGPGFNFAQWSKWAASYRTKINVGVLASKRIPGSGFVAPDELKRKLDPIRRDPQFGGLMIWDATYGFDPVAGSPAEGHFGDEMAQYIHSVNGPAAPVPPPGKKQPATRLPLCRTNEQVGTQLLKNRQ